MPPDTCHHLSLFRFAISILDRVCCWRSAQLGVQPSLALAMVLLLAFALAFVSGYGFGFCACAWIWLVALAFCSGVGSGFVCSFSFDVGCYVCVLPWL